jgi:mono/diheme cytochrome c family protein
MKNLKIAYLLPAIVLLASSCSSNPSKPGREYIPDMAHSVAYETNTENPVFQSGMTTQLPAPGAIARGGYSYPYANTPEGYEQSAALKNPFEFTQKEVEGEGKRLYTVNCAICHGDKGDGAGTLPETGKYPNPPSYYADALINKSHGQFYHSLVFGKNMMGSYAIQLDHRERWLVLEYVTKLQKDNTPTAPN